MKYELVQAHDIPLAEQAKVFTDAFAGYIGGSFQMDSASLATFICAQGIDLCYSRFARDENGRLASFAYVNRTGNITRLSGMGTVPGTRRSGAAGFLVTRLLDEATQRNDTAMVLEVIEQNPAAVALYRGHGFESVNRLLGWRRQGQQTASEAHDLRQVPIIEAMRFPARVDYPELPWAISRHDFAKVASAHAFASGDVAVVIGNPDASPMRLYGFLGFDGASWEPLRRLAGAVLERFSTNEVYAPPVFPEEFGRHIFEPLNFQKEPLTQLLMRKDL